MPQHHQDHNAHQSLITSAEMKEKQEKWIRENFSWQSILAQRDEKRERSRKIGEALMVIFIFSILSAFLIYPFWKG